ncbi:MAG: hypothetical protein FJW36_13415 [Acidobacteria bacterium]|nr:hypothetical protein [Acidobacteriota bacterium]
MLNIRFALLMVFQVCCLQAQSITGTIVGTATDATSAVVAGAKVDIVNEQTNATRTATTNESGNYSFTLVPPGTYRVESKATGFRSLKVTGVTVEVDRPVRVDLGFLVSDSREAITVTTEYTAKVETDTATLTQTIDSRKILDLPVARSFVALAAIMGGVVPVTGENGQSLQTNFTNRGDMSMFVSGQRESSVSFLIDGVESRGERLGNASMPVSLDGIQQMGIQRNTMSAEYGNATAVVNLSIKYGTNKFRGSLFEFFQNTHLNARNFFDRASKANTVFNNFGGSLGGPIVKDKTFFFVNYEGSRRRSSSPQLAILPTKAQMEGNLSTLASTIYDPATGNEATGQRAPFPGNIIPQNRIATLARNYAQFVPEPNLAIPINNNNFAVSPSALDDADQLHVRIDQNVRPTDNLFFRWSMYDANNTRPRLHPLWGLKFPWKTYNGAIQHTHIFGSSTINEFRFGYSRDNIFQRPEQLEGRILANDVGLRNTVQNEIDGGALPGVAIATYTSFGGGRPTGYISNRFQYSDTLSLTRGDHSLKIGVDMRRLQYNVFSSNAPNGDISFARLFTTSTVGGTVGGDALGDYLLGAFNTANGARTVNSPAFRNWLINVFIQDEWKATKRLHLSMGIRWEFPQRPYEVHDRIAVADFDSPGRLLFPRANPFDPNDKRIGTAVRRSIVDPDWNNFGPRFGLAYDLGRDAVVRAAYGIFYDVTQANEMNFLGFVPPFQTLVTLVNNPRTVRPGLTTSDLFPNAGPPTEIAPNSGIFSHVRTDRTPYVQQFNASVQKRILKSYLAEFSYVGALGRKQSKRRNFNQRRINEPVPFVPMPNFGSVLTSEKMSNSSYNALQVRLERQFQNGLSFLTNYTWSKSIDLDSAGAAASQNQDANNVKADRGLSDFDVRHRFVASATYELPFLKKNRWLGGWQTNFIATMQGGFPFTITAADTSGAGAFTVLRANRVGNGNLPRDQRTLERYFDTSAYLAPRPGTFGSAGRNTVIGPGIHNWSTSAQKFFPVREGWTLQFRGEFFNAFNHSQFFAPGSSVTTPANFGRIGGARAPRNVQLGLRMTF